MLSLHRGTDPKREHTSDVTQKDYTAAQPEFLLRHSEDAQWATTIDERQKQDDQDLRIPNLGYCISKPPVQRHHLRIRSSRVLSNYTLTTTDHSNNSSNH